MLPSRHAPDPRGRRIESGAKRLRRVHGSRPSRVPDPTSYGLGRLMGGPQDGENQRGLGTGEKMQRGVQTDPTPPTPLKPAGSRKKETERDRELELRVSDKYNVPGVQREKAKTPRGGFRRNCRREGGGKEGRYTVGSGE